MKQAFLILLMSSAAHSAKSTDPFTEPQAHPISRYEVGWQKNPFTLKTAPVAVTKESFAKDLALAGWRQAGDDSIVILVNTKTREYSRLKNQELAADGTKVKVAHLENRRSDTFVELERNSETAVVRYDETFLRQMSAQGAGPKPNPQSQPHNMLNSTGQGMPPGMIPNPQMIAQPQPVTPPSITFPFAPVSPAGMVPPILNTQIPQNASLNNNIPTPQRRRQNNLPQPIQR